MRGKRIRHVPVVENDRLLGLISIGDLIEDQNAENEESIQYPHEYLYGGYG